MSITDMALLQPAETLIDELAKSLEDCGLTEKVVYTFLCVLITADLSQPIRSRSGNAS